jgi:glycosyltransferase involved in cell wall biosynthesis
VRVSIITNTVLPYRQPFFDALARRNQWRLTVAHSGPPIEPDHRAWEELLVPTRTVGPFSLQSWRALARLDSEVNVVMFDLHWPVAISYGLARRSHVPLVFWGHGGGSNPIGRQLRRGLATLASGVIAYSPISTRDFVAAGVPKEKVHVAPNTMWIEKPRDTSGAAKHHWLFIGRLTPRKGVDTLLRAHARVARECPLDLVIVGDGPMRHELEQLARELGIHERIRFEGDVREESRLAGLLEGAAAYVSPGHVGLGVLHAFAYGVPVLTSQVTTHAPEVAWVEEGVTGMFTAPTVEGVAGAMLRLARDPALAKSLGAAAFRVYRGAASPEEMLRGFTAAVELAARRGSTRGAIRGAGLGQEGEELGG